MNSLFTTATRCRGVATFLFCLSTVVSFAQFGPPGGGPGGPPGMGGQEERKKKEFTGVADDAPKGNGKITGLLVDSTSGKPVEYATVALLNGKTNKPIDGTTSDANGNFSLAKLAPGDYRLQ